MTAHLKNEEQQAIIRKNLVVKSISSRPNEVHFEKDNKFYCVFDKVSGILSYKLSTISIDLGMKLSTDDTEPLLLSIMPFFNIKVSGFYNEDVSIWDVRKSQKT